MQKAVFKMNCDCGRSGSLTGVFVANKEHIDYLIKHEIPVHFGEVLGKHSDVSGTISGDEIKMISEDKKVIDVIEEHDLENGFNPLCYPLSIGEMEVDDEDIDMYEEYEDWLVYDYIHYKLTGEKPNY